MNSAQLALKKDLESVDSRMSALLPKVEFDKLKKQVEKFADKDKVDQIAEDLRSLDRGLGIYASTEYVDSLVIAIKKEYTSLIEPKL